jgi:hypothetical protein
VKAQQTKQQEYIEGPKAFALVDTWRGDPSLPVSSL